MYSAAWQLKAISLAISDRGENCGRWAFEGIIKTQKITRKDHERNDESMLKKILGRVKNTS